MGKAVEWIPNHYSNTFDKIINYERKLKVLPLTHKVTCFKAKSLLKDNIIQPIECDVFNNKKLIYLFYGIPSYEIAQGKGSRIDSSYCPVCFLLKYDDIKISNAFPFDSGAFKEDLYNDYLNEEMKLYDFALQTNIEYINSFVSTLYNTNEDYYKGKPRSNLNQLNYKPEIDYHIDSYIRIITKNGETKIDARAHTIELISDRNISLNDNLLAIIAPRDFCDVLNINDRYKGVEVLEYNTFYFDPPSSYNSIIKNIVFDYLKKRNIL